MTEILTVLRSKVTLLRLGITAAKFFKQFCNKLIEAVIPQFAANLYKCRPISEVGAEQLLLDTHALKTALLDLPNFGSQVSTAVPSTYTKLVAKHFTPAENLLKCLLSPLEPHEVLVDNYLMLFADNNLKNFMQILDLKAPFRLQPFGFSDPFFRLLPTDRGSSGRINSRSSTSLPVTYPRRPPVPRPS